MALERRYVHRDLTISIYPTSLSLHVIYTTILVGKNEMEVESITADWYIITKMS